MKRTVRLDGEYADVAGIRSVKTHPDFRREGLASAAMTLAGEFISRELAPKFSLLWSSRMAVSMYAKLGWTVLAAKVVCEQKARTVHCADLLPDSSFMISVPSEPHNIKTIDLCGMPW